MQNFIDIPSTDSLQNSRLKLINNDKTIMSCHSGTAFPTSNLEVGMFCFRTDLNQVFELKNLTPSWVLVADLNKTYTNKEYVDEQISNHGLHLPKLQTADSAVFLRNDGTWVKVTPANIGAAAEKHNQDASTITTGTLPVARGGTGNANGTVAKLTTARKINGVSFDGSEDITINAKANGGNAATVENKTVNDIISSIVATVPKATTISILTGTTSCVRSGSKNKYTYSTTLPIPSGFTAEQCNFLGIGVAVNYSGESISGASINYVQTTQTSTSSAAYNSGTIAYIVIGVK